MFLSYYIQVLFNIIILINVKRIKPITHPINLLVYSFVYIQLTFKFQFLHLILFNQNIISYTLYSKNFYYNTQHFTFFISNIHSLNSNIFVLYTMFHKYVSKIINKILPTYNQITTVECIKSNTLQMQLVLRFFLNLH